MEIPKVLKQAGNFVIKSLKVCKSLSENVPKTTDTTLAKALKTGAIIESAFNFVKDFNEVTNYYEHLHNNMGLISRNSQFLSKLLFTLWKEDQLPATIIKWNHDTSYVVFEFGAQKLVLYKQKAEDEITSICPIIHTTPNFDYAVIFNSLWEKYNNRIIIAQKGSGNPITIDGVSCDCDDIFVFDRESLLLDPEIGNCFLISGPPGTGKSTFVYKYGQLHNKKILKIDNTVANLLTIPDLKIVLSNLKPDIFLIDDFDRTSYARAGQDALYMFEILHTEYKGMLIALTANYPELIEKALLRTGRIDYIIEFDVPNVEERKILIEKYIKNDDIDRIVEMAEELSHADVVGFAKKINTLGIERAFGIISHLKEYQKKSKDFSFRKHSLYEQ